MKTPFTMSPQAYDHWFSTPGGQRVLEEETTLIRRMLWQEKGSLLDIGCGTGIFTTLFQGAGFQSFGLDLSREMLSHLKRKAPSLPLVLGDAHLLPFPRDAFLYSTMVTVLEFLQHPLYALVEAARVAKKGILIGFLPPWSPSNLKRRIKARAGRSSFSGAKFIPSSRLASMVKEACRINGKRVKAVKVEGCLTPRILPLPFLASFAAMRVDYE